MSYTRTTWIARVGTALNRFLKTNETSTEVELTNDPTGVTTAGTPFTVANMNKIEEGIYDAHYPEFTEAATLTNIASGEVGTTLWGKVKKAIAIIISWLDQGVKTTDSPTFASVNTGQGANELYPMNQGVRTTDSPTFANMNPPILSPGLFDAPPQIGVGGFTYARSNTPADHPTVTLPAIGTFICTIMRHGDNGRDCMVYMYEGGSVITGLSSLTGGTLTVLIHRIA